MAVLIGQMALLALPCRVALGENYDQTQLKEELVIAAKTVPDWKRVHPAISDVRALDSNLFALNVPTFKLMTGVLDALSQCSDLILVSISCNTEVQVRVSVPTASALDLDQIRSQQGCELMFKYAYPSDPGTTIATVGVRTPDLLAFFQFCRTAGITLHQVYDFFGG